MTVVSIDLETTGIDAERCQIVEIGAAVDDTSAPAANTPLDEVPQFHAYIRRDMYSGEPRALSMHKVIFERIAKQEPPYQYMYANEAAAKFAAFLRQFTSDDDKRVTVIGKNFASFDLQFLRNEKHFAEQVVPLIRARIIDVGTLFLDPGTDAKVPGMEECVRRAEEMLKKRTASGGALDWWGVRELRAHSALDDALQALRLWRVWRILGAKVA